MISLIRRILSFDLNLFWDRESKFLISGGREFKS